MGELAIFGWLMGLAALVIVTTWKAGISMNEVLRQAWWAPLAGLLVVLEVWIALVFLLGDGTSNILDWESTVAGATLATAGASALVAGLWKRPTGRGVGNALILVGAALAAIWFWTVVTTPIAIVVIIGVVISQVSTSARVAEKP